MKFYQETDTLDEECISCGEEAEEKCSKSKRSCGHHCNHSWSHEECCWCGEEFGEIEDSPEIELGREIGH
jgi:hypothetical protein